MIAGGKHHRRRFSNTFYGRLWAFFPEQVAMMTISWETLAVW